MTTTTRRAASPHVLEKRRRRRQEILHATLRAFRQKGFHATRLDDIAVQVGVRKAALYHYFPDKQSILRECHRQSLRELDRILREARAVGSATDQLCQVIREHVRVMTDTLQGSPLAFEVSAFPPDLRAEIIRHRDRYEREVRRIIERGMRRGEFRRVDSKIAAFVILGAINWIARWYRPEGTLHAGELGTLFGDQLLQGLSKP
jgi:TetR/AcrR family transcriptional regulator